MEPTFDELKEVKNPIIKEILLQKYGVIPAKLTAWEKLNWLEWDGGPWMKRQ